MKKILFVVGSLQIGGAETVMVDIINNIYNEYDITVLLIEKRGELLEKLTSNIKLKYLTKGDNYCNNAVERIYNKIKRSLIYRVFGKNKWYIKKIYNKFLKEKYDTEIGFLVGLPTEIVRRSPNKDSQKLTWIHASVEKEDERTYNKYLFIYKYFDKVIGVSEACIKTFENTFPESKGKIELIHNFIDVSKINKLSKDKMDINYNKKKINILSVGRIVDEKGYDRIINIAKKYEKQIDFYIVGTGELKEKFQKEIDESKIKNVYFLGLKKNPYPYIKNADAFLLSSRSEAYPTVVLEAMILKKFIIATNVSGVEEILGKYEDKIIIPNKNDSIENGIDLWLKKKEKNTNSVDNYFNKINEENLEKVKELLNR